MRLWLLIFVLMAGMLRLPASVVAQETTTPPPGVTIHVVQRGETLFRIAMTYGLTVDDLARINGLSDPSNIIIGQRLLIPAEGATPLPPQSVMHVVQPGETLESIARLYGLSADDLRAQNGLIGDSGFYVGLLLNVSSAEPTPAPATAAPNVPTAVIVHTVARGETLFRIAQQYGVTVNDLAKANQINDPTLIYAGQQLIIPGLEAPQLALDMPASVLSLNIAPLIFIEGQTGRVELTTDHAMTVSGTFLDQTLGDGVEDGGTQHTLMVGIPVYTAMGVYPLNLTLTDSDGTQTPLSANVQVISGAYDNEQIQLVADRANLLDPALDDSELAQLRGIMSAFTPTRSFDGPLGLPVAAPMSSHFGNHRSYNGGDYTRFHTGTDFAAAPGTPILAAAGGRVVFAGVLDVRGNATIIDHGWGVYTVYCHQTEQYVSAGDDVTAGQVIGTTGSSGRVTGAHLHWELWVNGVPVDAMQWVQDIFS